MDIVSNIVLVGIIIGLVEVIKQVGLPTKFLPLLAVALGVGASFIPSFSIYGGVDIVQGIVAGLSAVGLYAGTRSTSRVITDNNA